MTAAHWLIYCSDGFRRHDSPFESRGEALHWQTWGHYPCLFHPHTLRKIPLSSPVDPPMESRIAPGETRGALDLSGLRSVSGDDSFPVLPGEDVDGKNGVCSEPIGRSCSSGSESTPLLDLIPRLREVDWSPQAGAGNPFGEVRGQPFPKGTGR